MNDLKEKVEVLIKKIDSDKDFAEKFKKEPVRAVEDLLGIDLPDDQINSIIDTVKTKITADEIGKAAKKLQGLFK